MRSLVNSKLEQLIYKTGGFQCLDIGARGELFSDLSSIGHAVDMIGFEPDKEECDKLNNMKQKDSGRYRSIRYLPVAIGNKNGLNKLHLTRHRGASSFLKPRKDIYGRYYGTERLFDVEKEVEVDVEGLDDICTNYHLDDVSFIKIDVEGYELEIFKTALGLLSSSVLGIRAEVSFFPVRVDQPVFCEIESFLKQFDFMIMDFLFLHHWRAKTKLPQKRLTHHEKYVYRRQLIHGDALFFRNPDSIDITTDEGVRLLIKESILLNAYGYFDQAIQILERPCVSDYVHRHHGFSSDHVIKEMDAEFARKIKGRAVSGLHDLLSRIGL